MARGTNKGKRYIYLKGDEVAKPEDLKRANAFLIWYGLSLKALKSQLYYRGRAFDHDVAQDTALTIYDNIAFKSSEIKDIKGYFFMAYQTNKLKALRDDGSTDYIDPETQELEDAITEEYERELHELREAILAYVREEREAFDCTLYEMYEGLYPDISHRRLADMLGLPEHTIRYSLETTITAIRLTFKSRYAYLLSR